VQEAHGSEQELAPLFCYWRVGHNLARNRRFALVETDGQGDLERGDDPLQRLRDVLSTPRNLIQGESALFWPLDVASACMLSSFHLAIQRSLSS